MYNKLIVLCCLGISLTAAGQSLTAHKGMGSNHGGEKMVYQPTADVSPHADTVAPMTAQPASDDGGVAVIHHGMDMVKSGKELRDKGQADDDDKATMERGMAMMDKGMDIIAMGKGMMSKEKSAMVDELKKGGNLTVQGGVTIVFVV